MVKTRLRKLCRRAVLVLVAGFIVLEIAFNPRRPRALNFWTDTGGRCGRYLSTSAASRVSAS